MKIGRIRKAGDVLRDRMRGRAVAGELNEEVDRENVEERLTEGCG